MLIHLLVLLNQAETLLEIKARDRHDRRSLAQEEVHQHLHAVDVEEGQDAHAEGLVVLGSPQPDPQQHDADDGRAGAHARRDETSLPALCGRGAQGCGLGQGQTVHQHHPGHGRRRGEIRNSSGTLKGYAPHAATRRGRLF